MTDIIRFMIGASASVMSGVTRSSDVYCIHIVMSDIIRFSDV